MFPLFAVAAFAFIFTTYMNNVPMLMASLRVVGVGQQSLALGFRQIIIRFLGYVPGPILYGVMIDASCEVWRGGGGGSSGHTVNCVEYNERYFKYHVFAICCVLKILSFVFIAWAFKINMSPQLASTTTKNSAVLVNKMVDDAECSA